MAVQTIYAAGMGPNPDDSQQIALVKIVAWLAQLTSGMSVQQIYPVMTANPGDSPQVSLVKIVAHLSALNGGGGSGGLSNFFTFAAGAPPTDGSITTQGYWNTTDDTKYANTAWPDTAAPTWESM